jgi:hypothetical protein
MATLSQRLRLAWCGLLWALTSCTLVTPTNPYDTDTPLENQKTGSIVGTVTLEDPDACAQDLAAELALVQVGLKDGDGRPLLNSGVPLSLPLFDIEEGRGSFVFDDIVPGRYTVVLAGVAGLYQAPPDAVVTVTPGSTARAGDLTFLATESCGPGSVGGSLELQGGGQATITLYRRVCGETRFWNMATTGDGTFSFSCVPRGSYAILAESDGYTPDLRLDVQIGDTSGATLAQTFDGDDALRLYPVTAVLLPVAGEGVRITDGRAVVARDDVPLAVLAFGGVNEMRLSTTADFHDASSSGQPFVPYAATTSVALSDAQGPLPVFAQFRVRSADDDFVFTSDTYSTTVVRDITPPVISKISIDGVDARESSHLTSAASTVLLVEGFDAHSDIAAWSVAVDDVGGDVFSPVTTTANGLLSLLQTITFVGDGEHTVTVQLQDQGGNLSTRATQTVDVDTTAPVPGVPALSIDGEPAVLGSSTTTLLIEAAGATRMKLSNRADLSDATTVGFSSQVSWTFLPGEGTRTVYAQFLDDAGNASSPVSQLSVDVSFRGSVGGRVVKETGDDASGIVVAVTGSGLSATTDTDGSFQIENIPAGLWTVTAQAPGFVRFDFPPVSVQPSQRIEFEQATLRQERGRIVGYALRAGASTHENTRVTLTQGGATTFTAPDGRFELSRPVGNVTGIVASFDERFDDVRYDDTVTVTAAGDAVVPTLILVQTRNAVSGTVRLAGRSDHAGITVEFEDDEGVVRATAVTTSTGTWSVAPLPLGLYAVRVFFQEGWEEIETSLTVAATHLASTLPPLSLRERFVTIEENASVVTSRAVTLRLGASDAYEMELSEIPTFTDSVRERFVTTKAFTLSAANGTKTVYARFFDERGVVTGTAQDEVVLDDVAVISAFEHDADRPLARGDRLLFVLHGGEPGGRATVDITGYQTGIALFDDGTSGDDIADDGIYARLFVIQTGADVQSAQVAGHFIDPFGTMAVPASAPPLTVNSAPLLTRIEVIPDTDTATALVRWTTDELATAVVQYGPDNGYGAVVRQDTAATSHAVTLTGLTPSALVHFRITATDVALTPNTTIDQDRAFLVRPSAPSRVLALPGDGRVDVRMDASPQAHIAGYLVYRGLSDDPQEATPLNDEPFPVADELFEDDGSLEADNVLLPAPQNGVAYRYFVSAVDVFGGESERAGPSVATPTAATGAGTDVCGVQGDAVWTSSGSPYRLTCSFTLRSDASLTIGPATVVQVVGNQRVDVLGPLQVLGGRHDGEEAVVRAAVESTERRAWGGLTVRPAVPTSIDVRHAIFRNCADCLLVSPAVRQDVQIVDSLFEDAERPISAPQGVGALPRGKLSIVRSTIRSFVTGITLGAGNIDSIIESNIISSGQEGILWTGTDTRSSVIIRHNLFQQNYIGITYSFNNNAASSAAILFNHGEQNGTDLSFANANRYASMPAVRFNAFVSGDAQEGRTSLQCRGLNTFERPTCDVRANHWGAATAQMDASGPDVDLPAFVDFYEDGFSPKTDYNDWLLTAPSLSGPRNGPRARSIRLDTPSGTFPDTPIDRHLWYGERFFSVTTASMDLLVDAPPKASLAIATSFDFAPETLLTPGFVPADARVPFAFTRAPGPYDLFVVLKDERGQTGPVEILHVVVDDGLRCPQDFLWAVDEHGESCVQPSAL